jgi:hypothetical protein
VYWRFFVVCMGVGCWNRVSDDKVESVLWGLERLFGRHICSTTDGVKRLVSQKVYRKKVFSISVGASSSGY